MSPSSSSSVASQTPTPKGLKNITTGNRDVILIALVSIRQQPVALCAGHEDHAATLRWVAAASGSPGPPAGRCDRIQSAALLACDAARMIA